MEINYVLAKLSICKLYLLMFNLSLDLDVNVGTLRL